MQILHNGKYNNVQSSMHSPPGAHCVSGAAFITLWLDDHVVILSMR